MIKIKRFLFSATKILIKFDHSGQYFRFEHSSFEFVLDFVFRIFRQRWISLWQAGLAKLTDVFTDNLF